MSDTTDITAIVVGYDAVLGALPSVSFYVGRAIANHSKPQWFDGTGYDSYFEGMALWVLHKLTMAARSAGGAVTPSGPVQSKRTQDVSVTYAILPTASPVTAVDGDFSQTTWGNAYLAIRATLATGHTQVYG